MKLISIVADEKHIYHLHRHHQLYHPVIKFINFYAE